METPQAKILKDITHFLDKNEMPYMITGSWSSIYYGRPRASHDIDFVLQIQGKKLDRKYLNQWINKLKLKKHFDRLKKIDLGEYI